MTGAGVGDAEEVQTEASPSGMGDADDDTNGAGTDKLTAAGGRKGEVGVLPVLVVVIAGGGSTEDAAFIIGLTVGIGLVSVGAVGAGMERVVEGKVVGALTRAGNADEVAAGRGPEG